MKYFTCNACHRLQCVPPCARPASPGRPPLRARQRRLKPALFFRGTLY